MQSSVQTVQYNETQLVINEHEELMIIQLNDLTKHNQ